MNETLKLPSEEKLIFLGYDSSNGEEIFCKKTNLVNSKIGTAVNVRRIKKLSCGSVLLLDVFKNNFSGDSISYLMNVSKKSLSIDHCHAYYKLIFNGRLQVKKHDVFRKVFKPESIYTDEDIKLISDLFMMSGTKYFLKKIKDFENVDSFAKAKFKSKNFLSLEHVKTFKL
jgi:hypothetical protein